MIETALTIILFLFILTVIVCVHEFGHFIFAKKFGVQVDEFSIGMGPLLYKKMWHGTQYSIRALPIGGYVKMLGEGEESNQAGSYSLLRKWKKFVIIYAGVLMNFILAALIFTVFVIKNDGTFFGLTLDTSYSYPIADVGVKKAAVAGVEDGSPAQKAGMKNGEIINKINGVDYRTLEEFSDLIGQNVEKPTKFELISYLTGDKREVEIIPRDRIKNNLSEKQSRTGIITGVPFVRAEFKGWMYPLGGILQTYNVANNSISTLGTIITEAFKQNRPGLIADTVTGPVGTYAVTKRVLDLNGFWGILTLTAILSLTIGIMNALPFPSLDGWHGLFIVIEFITRRKVNPGIYNAITLAGFVVLLGLGVLIAIKDVVNFNRFFI